MALIRRDRGDWPELFRRWLPTDWDSGWLRVEEFREGDDLVVRAELPDIDPDKDVELSVASGVLHIRAQREEKTEHKDKDSYRSEFQYGSFTRNISLPAGVDESKVKAGYRDGVLEVRVPMPPEAKAEATKVPINRS
jgi:HSP20 family protein